MLIQELKNFSKGNWWIYLLLAIALTIVYITWKGNLIEIIILFLANFLWNLFIMVMQANYTAKNNKVWAIYHASATLVFTLISIYWLVVLNQSQYIIWQLTYILAAAKAFTFYNYWKDIKFINSYTVGLINMGLLAFFVYFAGKSIDVMGLFNFNFNVELFTILMALGFSFVTTGLVSTNDTIRYWFSFAWVLWIVSGSGLWLILWYVWWNIDGLSLGYLILTLTVFVFYSKLLKKYL